MPLEITRLESLFNTFWLDVRCQKTKNGLDSSHENNFSFVFWVTSAVWSGSDQGYSWAQKLYVAGLGPGRMPGIKSWSTGRFANKANAGPTVLLLQPQNFLFFNKHRTSSGKHSSHDFRISGDVLTLAMFYVKLHLVIVSFFSP